MREHVTILDILAGGAVVCLVLFASTGVVVVALRWFGVIP